MMSNGLTQKKKGNKGRSHVRQEEQRSIEVRERGHVCQDGTKTKKIRKDKKKQCKNVKMA